MNNMSIRYKVFVRTDTNDIITSINSSAFLSDTTDWIEIDEGEGERFYHAQNNYLSERISDENGIFNYILINGKPELRTDEDKSSELAHISAMREIIELKDKLADTDYIVIKLAEGAATQQEYADKLADRVVWRARINELEQI